MRTHFAEVLAREEASLNEVRDVAELAAWRSCVVRELMDAQSPYALALLRPAEAHDRADFLSRWRALIAQMADRLLRDEHPGRSRCGSAPASGSTRDPAAEETAVLILAALHGGSTLSQLAKDPWPLNAALDLALARLAGSTRDGGAGRDEETLESRG